MCRRERDGERGRYWCVRDYSTFVVGLRSFNVYFSLPTSISYDGFESDSLDFDDGG